MRRLVGLLVAAVLLAPAAPASHATSCSSPLPVSDGHLTAYSCTGVHPGMVLEVHSAKYGDIECSASYAFKDSGNNKYLALPGTCILDFDCLDDLLQPYPPPLDQPPFSTVLNALPCILPSDSELEPYYKKGTGPIVKDGNGVRIGRLAYAVNKDGLDFALVRLDPGVALDPALPLYGGPTKLGTFTALSPVTGHVYAAPGDLFSVNGNGAGGPNAEAAVLYSTSIDFGYASTPTPLLLGNPRGGSALTDDGKAAGMLTGSWAIGAGWIVKPFGPALAHLQARTHLAVTLMTAPLK